VLAGLVHDLGAFYMLWRAVQYPELRSRPDTVRYLIIDWHESIGVTLLNSLGVAEEIVQATIDHDRHRVVPAPVLTLADVVFVSNILADRQWMADALCISSSEILRHTIAIPVIFSLAKIG